jgi:hypothetical protein
MVSPTGRWISRDDPMWERVWVHAPPEFVERNRGLRVAMVASGAFLLALEDAFLAWGEMR